MAGCGYVCPVCEGSGRGDQGESCTWCTPLPNNSGLKNNTEEIISSNKMDHHIADKVATETETNQKKKK